MDKTEKYFELNAEGCNIRCKLYCKDPLRVRKAVITGHGFGGHKDAGAVEKFADRVLTKYNDVCVLAFNWPCHGDDVRKKLTLGACMLYLKLVVEYAKGRFPAAELYAYATSFGGYLFLLYYHRSGCPFVKSVFRCPAVNIYDVLTGAIMTEEELEKIKKGKDVPVGFDRKVDIGQAFLEELRENDIRAYDFLDFAENILILHGTRDEVVPFDESRKFAEDNIIEFIPAQGADHRFQDPKKMEAAIKDILKFYGW